RETIGPGDARIDGRGRNSQECPPREGDAPLTDQLWEDGLGAIDRHGESDALRDATDLWIRGCQRWHTHELSLQIDQRTAAVAWVDWRAGLDHVRDGGRLAGDRAGRFRDGTVERAHDAGGDGAAEADRVANGQHRLAHTQTGRVAQRHDGQVRLADLNDGQIVERIQPDELALHRLIVGQG